MSRINKPKHITTEAVAKGYRLRPETHELVAKLQKEISGTKDDVISRACEMYFEELESKKNNNPIK